MRGSIDGEVSETGGEKMSAFGADKVIVQHFNKCDLSTYFVGFDLDDNGNSTYRIDSLVKVLTRVIPEFAFGHHLGTETKNTEIIDVCIETAKAIYKIDVFQKVRDLYNAGRILGDNISDKYLRRGEFGELILHLLLRAYKDTIPLISKIFFKDAYGSTVHGFDAVHIHESTKTLWLGESKLYTNGKAGVKELIDDIKSHFVADYLNDEFAIISRKITGLNNIPEKDKWLEIMNAQTTLKSKFEQICIPLLCTYESELFTKYDDESLPAFIKEYEYEMNELKNYFDKNNDHPHATKLNLILLLFPIQSKKDLVTGLHKSLSRLQSVGEL